jgi:nitroreductase
MTDAPFDLSVTDRLLSTTRSVRKRLDLDRPVEPEVLLECLRLAVQAPTGSNRQGWRWMVVTDPGKKAELARLYRETGEGYLRAAAARDDGDPQTHRVYDSAVYLAENLERVPVHVIPCLQGRPQPGHEAGFFGSILPAAWSFMLALRSRGLGSAWTSLHLAKEAEAADVLGIPHDVTQAALLPVAYYTGEDFKPAARPPVEEITYWDSWGVTR